MQLPIVLGEIVLNDEDKLIMRALNPLDFCVYGEQNNRAC